MKKTLFALAMIVLLLMNFSCKKEDPNDAAASFSAKVQGTQWTAATISSSHLTGGNLTQIIAAGAMPSEQIALTFHGSGTGTFVMDDDYNVCTAVIGDYTFTSMFSDSPDGEIIITRYDAANGKISGTFHFKGEDIDGNEFSVTEGKFTNVDLVVM